MPSRFATNAVDHDAETQALAHNLLLKSELLEIVSALTAAGIEVVVLKGIPLAERVYGSIAARGHFMQDNDVLVHAADLNRAIATLAAIGYAPSDYRSLEPRRDVEFELKLHRVRHGVPLLVELHWHAFPPLLYPIEEELLWRHVEDFTLEGLTFKVFQPALTVLHLASHFVQHLGRAPWVLRDFATSYNRRHADLDDELLRLAAELGLPHVLAFAFAAARDAGLLSAEPPTLRSRRATLLARPPAWLVRAQASDYARLIAFSLLANPRRLPRWAARQVFPPLEVMALIYRTPITPGLYLRYVSRLFRPLGRNKQQ